MPAKDTNTESPIINYYIIYNRTIENLNLFSDLDDYQTFLSFLEEYLNPQQSKDKLKKNFSINGREFKGVPHQPKNFFSQVELVAYNLMPNHFHIIIAVRSPKSVEKFIRSLCTRYAIYFNKKYNRSGSLFIGPYKSNKLTSEQELLYLTRHLHSEVDKEINSQDTQNNFSSYGQYTETHPVEWVKVAYPLQLFNKLQNSGKIPGITSYASFVESTVLNDIETQIIDSLLTEPKPTPNQTQPQIEEQQDPSQQPEVQTETVLIPEDKTPEIQAVQKPESRLKAPAFATASVITFILLFSLGMNNINSSANSNSTLVTNPQPSPEVAGSETVVEDIEQLLPTLTPTQEVSPTQKESELSVDGAHDQTSATQSAIITPTPEPLGYIKITISDGSQAVNLRTAPTTGSESVGTAKDGEQYEYSSFRAGWYEIKIDSGTYAYISSRYATVSNQGGNNL